MSSGQICIDLKEGEHTNHNECNRERFPEESQQLNSLGYFFFKSGKGGCKMTYTCEGVRPLCLFLRLKEAKS